MAGRLAAACAVDAEAAETLTTLEASLTAERKLDSASSSSKGALLAMTTALGGVAVLGWGAMTGANGGWGECNVAGDSTATGAAIEGARDGEAGRAMAF